MKSKLLPACFLILLFLAKLSWGQVVVSSFSPSSGANNTLVTISGVGFDPVAADNLVYFGDIKAAAITATATSITARVPSTAIHGAISVLNLKTGSKSRSSLNFNVTFPAKGTLSGVNFDARASLEIPAKNTYNTVADINGDGKPDLITSDYVTKSIAILINKGNADSVTANNFLPEVTLPMPLGLLDIVVADMDGDGKQDIITMQNNSKIVIFKNKYTVGSLETGSFDRKELNLSIYGYFFAVADLDGDGKADILSYTKAPADADPKITVFKNKTSAGQIEPGSFAAAASIDPGSNGLGEVQFADLNGDNRPEIITTNPSYINVTIYQNLTADLGLNNSSFKPVPFTFDGATSTVSVADIDGDHKPDLLYSGFEKNVMYVLRNAIIGTEINNTSFVLKERLYTGKDPRDIKVADFDGDGKVDAALVNRLDSSLCIFRNIATSNPLTPWFAPKTLLSVPKEPWHLFIADFNADNKPDMLVIGQENTVTLIKNKPVLIPRITSFAPFAGKVGSVVKVKGLNFGNNLNDILVTFDSRKAQVTAVNNNEFSVIVPPGVSHSRIGINILSDKRTAWSGGSFRGLFPAKKNIELSDFKQVVLNLPKCDGKIKFSDLDGDGAVDMVYQSSVGSYINFYAQRNNSKAGHMDCNTFEVEPVLVSSNQLFGSPYQLKDVNNDGLPDLIIINDASYTGQVFINTSIKGKISFKETKVFQSYNNLLAVEDIDNDGLIDYVTPTSIFRNQFSENQTGTPYQYPVNLALNNVGYSLKRLIDVDGDGKMDAISNEDVYGEDGVRLNAGEPGIITDSSFTKVVIKTNTNIDDAMPVSIQDFDGDGKADIVSVNKFFKNESTTNKPLFKPGVEITKDYIYAYADFNGDGLPEQLTGLDNIDTYTDSAIVYQNRALAGQPPLYNTKIRYGYHYGDFYTELPGEYQATEDINNDGKPDFVFFTRDHKVYIFENVITEAETDLPAKITSFAPIAVPVNSDVTINMNSIASGPGRYEVYIGNQKATIKNISGNAITITVPAGASYGQIMVLDTLTKLQAYSAASLSIKLQHGTGADFTKSSFAPLKTILFGVGRFMPKIFYNDLNNEGVKKFSVVTYDYPTHAVDGVYTYSSSSTDEFNNPLNFTRTSGVKLNKLASIGAMADISGDNKPEMIGNDGDPYENALGIFENISSKNCGINFSESKIPYLPTFARGMMTADLNNDGKPDILSLSSNGNVLSVFLNNAKRGSISFNPFAKSIEMLIPGEIQYRINGIAVKDFDGDGKNDLLINSENGVYVFRNAGSDEPQKLHFDTPLILDAAGGSGMIVEDLDGDGKPEIICTSYKSLDICIYKNTSTSGQINAASVAAKISLPVKQPYFSITSVADMDGDGKPDIVYSEGGTADMYLYRNKTSKGVISAESFSNKVSFTMSAPISDFMVDDFNRDGRPDILVNINEESIGVLQNNIFNSGLDLAGSLLPADYISGDKAFAVDSAIVIIKTSGENITEAKVSIGTNFNNGSDQLLLTNIGSTMGNIVAAYNKPSGVLTLSSAGNIATVAQWQVALRAVTFSSTAKTTANKVISFNVTAGPLQSPTVERVINVKFIPPPIISSFAPAQAVKGTVITINGTGFTEISDVSFGGSTAASFNVVSDTKINAVVDTAAAQNVRVTGKYGTGSLTGFTFVPFPAISPAGAVTFNPGSNITFSVNAVNGVIYQWMKVGSDIALATGNTFTTETSGDYIVTAVINGQVLKSAPVTATSVFTLPATNFSISAISITCKGSKNGSIKIAATQNLKYTAMLSRNGVNTSQPFTGATTFKDLGPGAYDLCITVDAQPEYRQCYSLAITEPKDITLYSTVSTDKKMVTLALSGGEIYHIQLNNTMQTTRDSLVTLPLLIGRNSLIITTDKICQGVINRSINISNIIIPYPNPFDHVVHLNLGILKVKTATVEIYSAMGAVLYKKQFSDPTDIIDIDLSSITMTGTYTLKLITENSQQVFKIIKK